MIAAIPDSPVAVPAAVRGLVGAALATPVWRNELGGLTFRIDAADGRSRFLKWSPPGGPDLSAEIARLRWAAPLWPVPPVLDHGADDDGSWLLTDGLPGASAVDPRWVARPRAAVRAIGEALRALHDALPVADCPFGWALEDRRDRAHTAAAALGTSAADLARLADAPDIDRLVVCHGDACAPNTLIGDDGRFTGHVDLGTLGVADRWADLAVATWSTEWNYGPGWDGELLAAYGIAPDAERTAYYRLLWDCTP